MPAVDHPERVADAIAYLERFGEVPLLLRRVQEAA
jgi:hypothetical protein